MSEAYDLQKGLLRYDLGPGVEAFSMLRTAALPFPVVQAHQVHADRIAIVSTFTPREQLEGYDALITTTPGLALGARTADCVPVLLYDPVHAAIAAVHAGWKGTVLHITEKVILTLREHYDTQPSDLRAVIGPSIGPNSFQVGPEVVEAFRQAGFPIEALVEDQGPRVAGTMKGGLHLDLWQANHWLLTASGLLPQHIHLAAIDTYTAPTFFSARREGTTCGRIINTIRLKN